ncbi:dihydroorotate dehydrogenase [Sphaerochaeta globosa]|uniref:Dihydroorotate dehydrogenase family protein n=1 Tax=Sphaerochaeta globosa (strain ATCC BAA-1886 / DSM 22777 / Buddy) TaxID=158189 RepID=F0RTV2_SPHGB|nr:dihydroorotate dehydrogenase [Sphaerochaeta globosa]ADY13823.1 dihydroorotate dehydrogenase family protein [Sphaerochaeta globosa str. Buddy]
MKDVLRTLGRRHLDCSKEVLLTTVSGVASTKPKLITYFDTKVPSIGIITTKSFQVEVNPGNREPVICETQTGNFGNSVGLRNPGLQQALYELRMLRSEHTFNALLNVSLSANSIEDFITLVKAFDEVADLVELNFSCPHASVGYGASIGCDQAIAAEYVRAIKEATSCCKAPLFVKLTPNVEDIGSIAKAVMDSGADGLVAINTVGPIVHLDPVSGMPILQNKLGGKGGCSGKQIFSAALHAVTAIRHACGDAIPLIAMGGVSTGDEVALLVQAGADAVGIGSALGTVDQQDWPSYLYAVKTEAEALLRNVETSRVRHSTSFIKHERQMAYEKHVVTAFERYGKDTVIITLDGSLDCKAGQFAFLWLPTIGEKPFSVAHNKPLTFIIKKRGPFSEALCNLSVGSTLYVRGLYGAQLQNTPTKRALLLAGGTGVAVLPSLAKQLKEQGTEMTILIGTSEAVASKALLEDELGLYGSFTCVSDDGRPGRVLDLLDTIELGNETACYLVGPEIFMAIASRKLLGRNIEETNLYLSMERMTLCGIGMCGECACGDRLTCRWGTFMRYDFLRQEASELLAYD